MAATSTTPSGRKPSASVSARMAAVRQSNTAPEYAVRRMLQFIGVRYRTCSSTLPGRPDFSNQKNGWCIFVHGCFWHGHRCKLGRLPKINLHFWKPKIAQNKRRDLLVANKLRARGLRVLTVWQCELGNAKRIQSRLSNFLRTDGA
jgi:DNA mismatch endonuclease, patch repair protein